MESSSSSSSSSEYRISPTVSKEKWAVHARAKLLKGYVLIMARERRTASFFKEGRGFEPCPFKIAKALIDMGMVEEAGPHFLGIRYVLSSAMPTPPVLKVDDDDDIDVEAPPEKETASLDGLIDDLEEDSADDEGDSDEEGAEEGASDDEEEEEEDDDEF